MRHVRFRTGEAVILAAFVLLAGLFALVPWNDIARDHTATQNKKLGYSGAKLAAKKPREKKSSWQLSSSYSRQSNTLRLDLRHRYNRPMDKLFVFAEFSSDQLTGSVQGSVMRRETDGTYSSDDVRLGEGDWLMSVTGVERNQFKFRIEQILRVE